MNAEDRSFYRFLTGIAVFFAVLALLAIGCTELDKVLAAKGCVW